MRDLYKWSSVSWSALQEVCARTRSRFRAFVYLSFKCFMCGIKDSLRSKTTPRNLGRDPFGETETGSSFGFTETACFTVKLKPDSQIWWNHPRSRFRYRNGKKDGGFHLVTCPEISLFENIKVFTNHRISALLGSECFTNRVAW